MSTKHIVALGGTQLYIGDKPIAIAESSKVEFPTTDDDSDRWNEFKQHLKKDFSFSCDVSPVDDKALHDLMHNYLVAQWRANNRGNTLHYLSYWKENNIYLNRK